VSVIAKRSFWGLGEKTSAAPRRFYWHRPGRALLLGALGLSSFFLLWWLASLWIRNVILLPSPWAMFAGLIELAGSGSLWKDIFASLRRVFTGFAIAASLAVPLGLVLAYSRTWRHLVMPVVVLLRPIPPIAWIPLAIVWFGIGDHSSFAITAVAAFFPIFLNTFAGGIGVDSQHLNAAASLGAGRAAILRRIYFPSALPMILTGLRIGMGQAWMAVVTAELVAAQSGLGFLIQMSRLNLETSHVLVGMFVIGVIGSLMTSLLSALERQLLPWKE